jgi:hypothetical protein
MIAGVLADQDVGARLGESRWVPAAVVFAFMALNIVVHLSLSSNGAFGRTPWVVAVVEAVLLVVLPAVHPGSAAERRRLRHVSSVLVGLLVMAALWATSLLVYDLIKGAGVSNSPDELLAAGAMVWLGNNLAFALVFWLFDGGGPIARTRRVMPHDFAFTQHLNPEISPPGWRPVFLDYLHLGFTNATAFSPTDVMPLTHRAKYAMLVQSTVAFALIGLVIARAVNAFT